MRSSNDGTDSKGRPNSMERGSLKNSSDTQIWRKPTLSALLVPLALDPMDPQPSTPTRDAGRRSVLMGGRTSRVWIMARGKVTDGWEALMR